VHNKGLFLPFVEKYKPDVICLQETKAKQHQSEVDLPEYEEYWNSAEKAGYSGTAIFCKRPARPHESGAGGETPLSVALGFPEDLLKKYKLADEYGNPNTEGRVLTAEFKDLYIVNVYTPNSKEDLSRLPLRHKQWDPVFLEYVGNLEKTKPVVFCGDMNVAHTEDDLANPKPNEGKHGYTKEERIGMDKMVSSGFIDTFRHFTKGKGHYTWWAPWANARANNVGWRIDYFFASKDLLPKIKSSKILASELGSDHCPIQLEIL